MLVPWTIPDGSESCLNDVGSEVGGGPQAGKYIQARLRGGDCQYSESPTGVWVYVTHLRNGNMELNLKFRGQIRVYTRVGCRVPVALALGYPGGIACVCGVHFSVEQVVGGQQRTRCTGA